MSALQKCMVEIATRVVPVFALAHGLHDFLHHCLQPIAPAFPQQCGSEIN